MNELNTPSSKKYRIALGIEYDGSSYSGWQCQKSPKVVTIQGHIDAALSKIADSDIKTICAGRTDAGVHATNQVVHFDSPVDRGVKAWTVGVNSILPKSIRVLWAKPVETDYHARFSAQARRYNYVFYHRKIESALLSSRVTHVPGPLNTKLMHEATQALLGEHDFSAFRAAGCQSKSAKRRIISIRCLQRGPFIIFDVKANAFLLHMVRNLAGALLEIGEEKREVAWMSQLLTSKDRKLAGLTAPPDGLYLVSVDYPLKYNIRHSPHLPINLNET